MPMMDVYAAAGTFGDKHYWIARSSTSSGSSSTTPKASPVSRRS